MIILGEDIHEKDCSLRITEDTKNFVVGFFGFIPHDMSEYFIKFVNELEIDTLAGNSNIPLDEYTLNGTAGLEAYDCCDRRTFDVTIVLPKTFETKKEAKKWFKKKLKNSKNISENLLSDIKIVDGDKVVELIKEIMDYKNKKEDLKDTINQELKALKEKLIKEFEGDTESIGIINREFPLS